MKNVTLSSREETRPAPSERRPQSRAVVVGRCTERGPDDDFFCLRYQVWYPSLDCAYRTRFVTAPGCRECDQGRFNLKRHAATLARANRPLRLLVRD